MNQKMHSLYVWPGAHGLASIDPACSVVASYCQLLLSPDDFEIVECSDFNESLPFLKHGERTYAASAILPYLLQQNLQEKTPGVDDSRAIHSLLNFDILPLVLHSLFSVSRQSIVHSYRLANTSTTATAQLHLCSTIGRDKSSLSRQSLPTRVTPSVGAEHHRSDASGVVDIGRRSREGRRG